MIKMNNSFLSDLWGEVCEEQNIDIDSCKVYALKTNEYEGFPYAIYVETKETKTPLYFGDEISELCFENYRGKE